MAFDGTEGAPIGIDEAVELTKRFRDEYPDQPRAQYMGIDLMKKLLSQDGVVGFRMYNGLDALGKMQPIFVGVYANEDDNLSLIADSTLACPPRCSNPNPINP